MARIMKIVADSSANVLELEKVAFAAAPLKVITDEREFVDTNELDVDEMISCFRTYNGRSRTSCPNPHDWIEAFGDADDIFCVAITSGLSGSYNAACIAKQTYEEAELLFVALAKCFRVKLTFTRNADIVYAYSHRCSRVCE